MITKNYIKMCVASEELQKLCKHRKGDWFYNREKPVLFCKAGLGSFNPHEHIWLPTQEQLQEILLRRDKDWDEYDNVIGMLYNFELWVGKKFYGYFMHKDYPKGNIFNELWLAFVMSEKYNKVWNGSKWVANE